MTMTLSKKEYFNMCMEMPVRWLRACVNDPSPYQNQMQLALVLLALRKKGE
jgi:hypothetical protein